MRLAEAFPVGEYLAEELEARGWSQAEFADVIQRPTQFVSEVISGKKELTRESAAQIGTALGQSPELWLNLQDQYHLWLQRNDPEMQRSLSEVEQRARLNDLAPMPLLRKRGIITKGSVESEVQQVCRLFGIASLEEDPGFLAAARRSDRDIAPTNVQKAWLAVAREKAKIVDLPAYRPTEFRRVVERVCRVVARPQGFADLPQLFAETGVALVYEENFPGSKIDGASFQLGSNPAIALSGRGKRLDKVLFTLLHESSHVLRGHLATQPTILDDSSLPPDEDGVDVAEQEADADAAAWILPAGELAPPARITNGWVESEADRQGVHPIVVVGGLQKAGHLDWRSALSKGAPTATTYLMAWATNRAA